MTGIAPKFQPAPEPAKSTETPSPLIVEKEKLLERIREVYQSIATRAYELFESRGRQVGYDLEDWLRAELELLRPMPIDISETEDKLIVRAELPGLTVQELKVSIEPRRIIVTGKSEQTSEHKTEKSISREHTSNEVFRSLDLPVIVDPAMVTATFENGVLELSISKAIKIEPAAVDIQAK